MRADLEASRVPSLRGRRRCAPSPSRGARQPSGEIRYQAAVSLRAIPGRKRIGKRLCTFSRPVGWARSGSGYRQVSLAQGRAEGAREPLARRAPAVPGAGTHLTAPGRVRRPQGWRRCWAALGAPEQGPWEDSVSPNAGRTGLRNLVSFSLPLPSRYKGRQGKAKPKRNTKFPATSPVEAVRGCSLLAGFPKRYFPASESGEQAG